jgi:6-phosphogluconate dehydrogenase
MQTTIGLIGLGVMGENLALNLERHGFSVTGFDLDEKKRNTLYLDTQRRMESLEGSGILYVESGVSSGEKGALRGPAMMPGGSSEAWSLVRPFLQAIAANLLQAQRDYFGAHTYQRLDKPGKFHTQWPKAPQT